MGAMPMKLLECDAAVMIVCLLLSCRDQHCTEPENCKPAIRDREPDARRRIGRPEKRPERAHFKFQKLRSVRRVLQWLLDFSDYRVTVFP